MFRRKKQISILSILMIMFFCTTLFSQIEKLEVNKWITDWYLLGPFNLEETKSEVNHIVGYETDFLKNQGGENSSNFNIDEDVNFGNDIAHWTEYSSPDSIINLDIAVSQKRFVVAYAYKEILVEKSGTYILSIGTNDGGSLWLNGEKIWDYPGARGVTPDEDLIPVVLNEGKNKILLKVEERGNNWGFCVRVLPFSIETFSRKGNFFKVVPFPNGDAELRFLISEKAIASLFKSVDLELYSKEDSSLIWERKWSEKQRMKLELENKVVGKYFIKIESLLQDNRKFEYVINFTAGKQINYSLFSKGTTKYKIVVDDNASESEKWAAEELQNYLFEISGTTLEIANADSEIGKNEIIIGYNKHSRKLLGADFSEPVLLNESFLYKNINSNIVLIGGKQRGTMYAVFSFLENVFGIRWYTPSVTVVPKKKEYSFNYLNHSERPSIKVRNDFYYEAFDPTWAAHNKINGAMGFREQHGNIEGYWAVHTFYRFMPPSEFYDKHPEYYSLIDGKRIHEKAQLCLTNPDVLSIITERLKTAMRKNPSNLIYSVSQNDWRNPCQCSNCQAIVDRNGGQSGIMLWFVNQVAENIKQEFPNKFVGTLAYQYTRKPPKNITPNANVVIRLCSIECCFAHDFYSCPQNEEFLSDLEQWSAISPHMYIWDYVVNFSHYIQPYPNFNVLKSNIKTFKDNNAIGIMEQAAYQSRGGEFAELRSYLISKLLWNVESSVEKVVDDFMYGYYGRSGQYVKEYFNLLQELVKRETHIHLGLKPEDKIFTEKFINDSERIFDKAEVVAENIEIKRRVEVARLPVMYLKCRRNPIVAKYDGTYKKFNSIVEREGITHFAEVGKAHIDDFQLFMKRAE